MCEEQDLPKDPSIQNQKLLRFQGPLILRVLCLFDFMTRCVLNLCLSDKLRAHVFVCLR